MMFSVQKADDSAIRTEEVSACLLCEAPGEVLYSGLQDGMFGTPGRWNFSKCPHCGFIWLSPRPIREDIPKCYENFYTHEPFTPLPPTDGDRPGGRLRNTVRRLILGDVLGYPHYKIDRWWARGVGKALAALPALRRRATYGLDELCPPFIGQGQLLEVGCGNGSYLCRMRDLGWQVTGLDLDPQAARTAEEASGIPVVVGALEQAAFPSHSFDVIHTYHVIEHLPEPIETLRECYRILRPGGMIIIGTPNVKSLLHWWFKENADLLFPPYHLCLFTSITLRRAAEQSGFSPIKVLTRSPYARHNYNASWHMRHDGFAEFKPTRLVPSARWFAALEGLLMLAVKNIGDEIVLWARKPAQ